MKIYIISILAVMLVCLSGENILADQSLYPLEPADRSSPRATLQTFLDDMNKAVEEYKAYHGGEASNFARRAAQCLNLESKPPAIRDTLGFESVIYLKEILDRIDIPPVDEIPDKKKRKNGQIGQLDNPTHGDHNCGREERAGRGAIPVYKQYRRKFREILQ